MNYYPKILPFYMTYPMPLIWEEEDTVMRCRVVAVDGENQLLLADVDGDHPDIYTLDASSVPLYRKETEGGTLLADGQLSAGARSPASPSCQMNLTTDADSISVSWGTYGKRTRD